MTNEPLGAPAPETDWQVAPLLHAEDGGIRDTTLADVLRSGPVIDAAKTFNDMDTEATKGQVRHRGAVRFAMGATALAATIAGARLVYDGFFGPFAPGTFEEAISRLFGVAQSGALLVVIVLYALNAQRNTFDSWLRNRSRAERDRIKFFEAIWSPGSQDAALRLEYIRRFLWNSQANYFRDAIAKAEARVRMHRTASFVLSMVLTLCALVILGLGVWAVLGLRGGFDKDAEKVVTSSEVWLRSADLIAQAFVTAAIGGIAWLEGKRAMWNDARIIPQYRETLRQLSLCGGEWDAPAPSFVAARDAVRAGDPSKATTWVDNVFRILEDDHRAWRDGAG